MTLSIMCVSNKTKCIKLSDKYTEIQVFSENIEVSQVSKQNSAPTRVHFLSETAIMQSNVSALSRYF